MNYRRDRKRKSLLKFIIVAIIAAGGYVFFTSGIFTYTSRVVHTAAAPLWRAGGEVASLWDAFAAYMSSKRVLEEENKRLRGELDIAKAKLLDRDLLYEENLELKKRLGRPFIPDTVVTGFVLARPDKTPYDTFIIDIGEGAGIAAGDNVVLADDIIIGKIVEVYKDTAKVLLYSAPGEQIDVFVGAGGVAATAIGRGGGSFEIRLPRGVEVSEGDAVYLPGANRKILGYVAYVEMKPSDPFKTVIVRGPVNIFTVKEVEVIKNKK